VVFRTLGLPFPLLPYNLIRSPQERIDHFPLPELFPLSLQSLQGLISATTSSNKEAEDQKLLF